MLHFIAATDLQVCSCHRPAGLFLLAASHYLWSLLKQVHITNAIQHIILPPGITLSLEHVKYHIMISFYVCIYSITYSSGLVE